MVKILLFGIGSSKLKCWGSKKIIYCLTINDPVNPDPGGAKIMLIQWIQEAKILQIQWIQGAKILRIHFSQEAKMLLIQ